ncbi:MAG: helix-turn-helix transcriptional regulator [Clostridia bacterium]|nr:helix-turn-helix transcriptional regulator [Clostridia bacterium]
MHIGTIIRDYRKERGLTLTQVAQRLNVSPSYLSSVERNLKRPTIPMLKKISEVLNISVSYLLLEDHPDTFASKLRFFREARGLNLYDLAEISEIPIATLEAFERGLAHPELEQLEKIAEALNVPIRYFLDGIDNLTELGSKLRQAREKQGLSVTSLAEKAGVSPGLISQIENNQTVPLLDTLQRIANALGVSISYFFMRQEDLTHLLSSLSPGVLEALRDPQVQAVLRAVRDFSSGELNYILKYIDFFKHNRRLL